MILCYIQLGRGLHENEEFMLGKGIRVYVGRGIKGYGAKAKSLAPCRYVCLYVREML